MSQLILVVEDDPMMQRMAVKILGVHGYQCEVANNGRDGIAMVERLHPALILMDLSLPEINGWEAARTLKTNPQTASIPIVATTAHAMVGDRESALEAGCDECLTKPYEINELITIVARFIGPATAEKKSA
jgi:two-component system, cell cycle response regulator DivK